MAYIQWLSVRTIRCVTYLINVLADLVTRMRFGHLYHESFILFIADAVGVLAILVLGEGTIYNTVKGA